MAFNLLRLPVFQFLWFGWDFVSRFGKGVRKRHPVAFSRERSLAKQARFACISGTVLMPRRGEAESILLSVV